jgi:hypothetical protein
LTTLSKEAEREDGRGKRATCCETKTGDNGREEQVQPEGPGPAQSDDSLTDDHEQTVEEEVESDLAMSQTVETDGQ